MFLVGVSQDSLTECGGGVKLEEVRAEEDFAK